ncbi:MAG: glycosyltransferase family 2 protein [Coleofasciculus sp.]|uniref:glycosyltransferase family 2 protein n=1 Tax=Coleofasciculus sp. TaxID=3100458 RepID=UPI003A289D27
MSTISIVIPVRNRKDYTNTILSQIHQQIVPKNENAIWIVVVDDGSTDGTQDLIRTKFPQVHLIQGDGSLWWTGAIVRGMQYAIDRLATDYFVWLNDDISIPEDFMIKLEETCNSPVSKSAVIGGIVCDTIYPNWIVFSGMVNKQLIRSFDYFANQEIIKVDTLNGNIAIIPRTIVDKIGLPDAERFRHYGGDFEFVYRVRKAGFKVLLSSRLKAKTDYQIGDFIRYMPAWMQWYFQRNLSQRKAILKGFTNLKSHHNIWHMVNINYCGYESIPQWKYIVYYWRQILKIFVINFWSRHQIKRDIEDYVKQQNAPRAIVQELFNQTIK